MTNCTKADIKVSIETGVDESLNQLLNSNEIINLSNSLSNFVINAIEKYRKGQNEHGGNLCDRNLQHEISQEIIDLFWYNEASKWKQQS